MPTPSSEILEPVDHSPFEIESLAELAAHAARGTVAHLTVQGLPLMEVDLTALDVTDTLFIGCILTATQTVELIRRGAQVVPAFDGVPYPTQPSRLYTAHDLADGFASGGFEAMFDTRVYRHYVTAGGATPALREALTQRIHDHGIENALAGETSFWTAERGPTGVVGVMGGHAEHRGTPAYRATADLARQLALAGRLVLTGGGPGAMEAANLGAYLSSFPEWELSAAIDILSEAPEFRQHEPFTAASMRVRERYVPDPTLGWERRGGLSIPTWFFGHEPANLFAASVGKLFSNAAREELILRLARGGILFTPGRAGTVQEVFQAANLTYYGITRTSGPFVFLDRRFWTEVVPVEAILRPLLAASPHGDQSALVVLTDDLSEAFDLLTSG